jgi:hypothetical protein
VDNTPSSQEEEESEPEVGEKIVDLLHHQGNVVVGRKDVTTPE